MRLLQRTLSVLLTALVLLGALPEAPSEARTRAAAAKSPKRGQARSTDARSAVTAREERPRDAATGRFVSKEARSSRFLVGAETGHAPSAALGRATARQLITTSGVSQIVASRILSARTARTGLLSFQELAGVKGMSAKTLARIEAHAAGAPRRR